MVQIRKPANLFDLKSDDPKRNRYVIDRAKDIVKDQVMYGRDLCEDCRQNWLHIGTETPACCPDRDEESFLKFFTAHQSTWSRADELAGFIALLKEHKDSLKEVNKIVCFGLGPTVGVWQPIAHLSEKAEQYRVCCQYAIAIALAEVFQELKAEMWRCLLRTLK
ncbi:hypothetical protein GGR57DRAFT_505095 [Xylariaceae sp. FL1272]|nr:hypothetical protein GGR57DRAFT_505095 [Xylariaceae sp. FL1272]